VPRLPQPREAAERDRRHRCCEIRPGQHRFPRRSSLWLPRCLVACCLRRSRLTAIGCDLLHRRHRDHRLRFRRGDRSCGMRSPRQPRASARPRPAPVAATRGEQAPQATRQGGRLSGEAVISPAERRWPLCGSRLPAQSSVASSLRALPVARRRALKVSAKRPLARSKRGAGRACGAWSPYPRQNKRRALLPTVTTTSRPTAWPNPQVAKTASLAISAERPAFFECRCAMIAGAGLVSVPALE